MNFRFKDFPQLSFGLSHVQKTNDRNEREKTKYTKRTVENKTSSETRKYAKMREMFVYCESTSQQTDWQGIVLAYTQPTCTRPPPTLRVCNRFIVASIVGRRRCKFS